MSEKLGGGPHKKSKGLLSEEDMFEDFPDTDDSDFLKRLEGDANDNNEEDEEGGSIMDRRTKQSDLDRMLIPFDDDDDDINTADLALPTCYDDEEDVNKYFDDEMECQEDLFKNTMRQGAKSLAIQSRYALDEDEDDELEVANDFDEDNDRDEDFSAKYLNVRNSVDTLASQINDLVSEDL